MSAVVIPLLLDTGERPYWTPSRRIQLGRCVRCEWHTETQGHHPYCPDANYCTCPPPPEETTP